MGYSGDGKPGGAAGLVTVGDGARGSGARAQLGYSSCAWCMSEDRGAEVTGIAVTMAGTQNPPGRMRIHWPAKKTCTGPDLAKGNPRGELVVGWTADSAHPAECGVGSKPGNGNAVGTEMRGAAAAHGAKPGNRNDVGAETLGAAVAQGVAGMPDMHGR